MSLTTTSPGGALIMDCGPPPRTGTTTRSARGYPSGKDDYLPRLRKIEGQVRGLRKMIEADRSYPDVVIQVASATGSCKRSQQACSPTTCATAS